MSKQNVDTARRARVRLATLVVGFGITLIAGLTVSGGSASAHAMLERTSPAEGSVVATAPSRVDLTFSEQVSVRSGDVKVYDDKLQRLSAGLTAHPGGKPATVGVGLRSALAKGTYSVTWQVVSADSHPLSGGYRFSIGAPSAVSGTAPQASTQDRVLETVLGITRAMTYTGLVLGIGLGAIALLLWPAGRFVRRVEAFLVAGMILLAAGALLGFLVQGPYTAGDGVASVFTLDALGETAGSRFGVASLIRLALALAGLALVGGLCRKAEDTAVRPRAGWLLAYGLIGVGTIAALGLAGHAGSGSLVPLALLSDVIHVSAMSAWMGGLVLLACVLTGEHRTVLPELAPKFSPIALGSVAAIAVSGGFQAWREVRYPAAFFRTEYGLLVTGKIVLFLALVGLGYLARRWIARHRASVASTQDTQCTQKGQDIDIARFRRGILGETAVGAVVLVITAVLVHTPQAKETYATSFSTTVGTGQQRLSVEVDRPHTGPARLRIALESGSRTSQVSGALSLPGKGIGPLPVTFAPSGRDAASHVDFAVAGRWQLDLTVQLADSSATTYRAEIPVR